MKANEGAQSRGRLSLTWVVYNAIGVVLLPLVLSLLELVLH